jgi:hypothetical protein
VNRRRHSRSHRRTAAAAVTVLAAVALSGCAAGTGTAHPGAAAVVGDQRIAVATLQSEVTAYRTALAAGGTGAAEPASVPAQTLQWLVLAQVVQQTVAEHGLTVTEGQVQQAEASDAAQAGGVQALQAAFVSQLALAPSSMELFYRMRAGEMALLAQAGVGPTSSQAGAELQQILAASADRLGVQVNPRYGVWNAGKLALGAPSEPWLKA